MLLFVLCHVQNTVIAVSGEPARRDFFTCKGFDLNEGFKVLSGAVSFDFYLYSFIRCRKGTYCIWSIRFSIPNLRPPWVAKIPMLPGVTSDLQARRISIIHKRLATSQNEGHLCRRECFPLNLSLFIVMHPGRCRLL